MCFDIKKKTMETVTGFFNQGLERSAPRVAASNAQTVVRLDRNESPYPIEVEIKLKTLDMLGQDDWNRYPNVAYSDVYRLISQISGYPQENLVVGAGAANLISTFLNYCGLNNKDIVIASPSFSLYEYHCKTYNIPYRIWSLNDDLEYDLNQLHDISANTVVVLASPNNPVGNILDIQQLVNFLTMNPSVMVLLDEVYGEFAGLTYQALAVQFPNLIAVKSFSKTFSAAGVRLGYAVCNSHVAAQFRKLMLSFSLNSFTVAFVKTILGAHDFLEKNQQTINKIIAERERLFSFLTSFALANKEEFKPIRSYGNFILVVFHNPKRFQGMMRFLDKRVISVLNTSTTPGLSHSLRITIGTPDENDAVIACFQVFFTAGGDEFHHP
jgi:histidinol-phosphate aminotransferase